MSTDDPMVNGDTTAETDKEIIGPNVPPGTKVTAIFQLQLYDVHCRALFIADLVLYTYCSKF